MRRPRPGWSLTTVDTASIATVYITVKLELVDTHFVITTITAILITTTEKVKAGCSLSSTQDTTIATTITAIGYFNKTIKR